MEHFEFLRKLHDFIEQSFRNRDDSNPRTLLIHSDSAYLVRQIDQRNIARNDLRSLLEKLLDILAICVRSDGAMLFPGFFNEYARHNESYDVILSPPSKDMGALSRLVFKSRETYRDSSPLTNLIGIGEAATRLERLNSNSHIGFAKESIWSEFATIGTKVLFIGVPATYLTYIHFLESTFNAPYIFNKYFKVPVLNNGNIIHEYSICPVRFRDSNIRWNFTQFLRHCLLKGAMIHMPGSGGLVSILDAGLIEELFRIEFEKNPFFLLEKKNLNYLSFQSVFERSLDGIALPNFHKLV